MMTGNQRFYLWFNSLAPSAGHSGDRFTDRFRRDEDWLFDKPAEINRGVDPIMAYDHVLWSERDELQPVIQATRLA